LAVLVFLTGCKPNLPAGCFPADLLPPHISPLTTFGQRAEWSLDGSEVYFVDSAGGNVWKVDLKDRIPEKVTQPGYLPEGHGYYRVYVMANGDLLLTCGPERYDLYFQVLGKDLDKPPVRISESINEGAAVSRNRMKIAWSPEHWSIWTADIVYRDGIPLFENKRMVVDSGPKMIGSVVYNDRLEPQDFRPPADNELIWAQYGHTSTGIFSSETMGIDLESGRIINYSNEPEQYDEPEGIFPDGDWTLIECDRHQRLGTKKLELYRLKLDGTGTNWQRLTYFSDEEGYRATNPVVRDDGKMIAFQASFAGSAPGAGCGIYLFDLEMFEAETAPENPPNR